MQERTLLTIEKIPVRLSLSHLSSEECLIFSARNYFSSRGRHPMQHPLMHQIDRNPDCQGLAICLDNVPIAHCFYHFRINSPGKKEIQLHNFLTAPYLRGRGLGSLLALHLLDSLLTPGLASLAVNIEFPLPTDSTGFKSGILSELLSSGSFIRQESQLPTLKSQIQLEEKTLTRELLSSLITKPDFRKRLSRKECFLGAISGSNAFFEGISAQNWPDYVVMQAIHMDFHQEVESKVASLDMLTIENSVLKAKPHLLEKISKVNPHLPVVVVGKTDVPDSPSILFCEELPNLAVALAPYLKPFDPVKSVVRSHPIRKNLLHLPEPHRLRHFKNLHRGGRLFIIASGPSLAEVDPSQLAGETTLTINDALVRFPNTRYAAVMDSRKLHELHLELLGVESLFTLTGNSYGIEIDLLGTEGFSNDLEQGIYSGYTTAYFTLQIAYYMGFKEIYYLGLDLGNTSQRSHFFGSRAMQDRDRPEVYAKMRQSFERIAGRTKELNLSVYNCSSVSELKSFPFRSLKDVLSSSPSAR